MRVLLDACVDEQLGELIVGHEVIHARQLGWESLTNGNLIRSAEADGFEVLVTVDKNMRYQQNLSNLQLSIITLMTLRISIGHLTLLVPKILEVLEDLPLGTVIELRPD